MTNIRDNILEMKNMSELILDLAYSALFLHDARISTEVKKLYERIRVLETDTTKMLFKAKIPDEERMVIIELTDHITNIATNAVDIAVLSKAKRLPGIIKDLLQESDTRIITAKISKHSILANNTLGESKIRTHTKAHIIGINREDTWIFEIDKDTLLLKDDLVIATGPKDAEHTFKSAASGKLKRL